MVQCFKTLLFLLVLLVTACCSTFVQEPKVSIKAANIVSLDTAGAEIEFYLGVTNPNPFDLSLLGYTYDLKVMALPLVSGGLPESILFKAGAETDMRLPVRVRFSDIVEILKRRPDPDKIPYQMNARLQIKTFAGEMTIPVESNSTFSVPEKYRPSYYQDRLKDLLRQLSP
jgi:LEA14-like dessication related protein